MKRCLIMAAMAAVLATACGCATPERRIRHNPDLFASFPPDVQERVRQGRVEVGFGKDMVRMAMGDPARVMIRETPGGVSELWTYVDYDRRPGGRFETTTFYMRDGRGRLHAVPDVMWVDQDLWYERDRVRIEFQADKVTVIERAARK